MGISHKRQESIMNAALELMRDIAPKDTENLADNGLLLKDLGDGKWRIYVDNSIAPYMPYTNEQWVDEKWRNKKTGEMHKNPNEGWWHVACQEAIRLIGNRLKGTIRQ